MVYFLQPVDGGPIKIGHSSDVDRRRVQLESRYGRELAVLAVISGGREEERAIHAKFSHLKLGRTEQFQPSPDLLEFIGRPLLVTANPEAVQLMTTGEDKYKPIIATMRGSLDFKAFLEMAAKKDRLSVADFIERAVVRYARELGIQEEPPER